MNSPLINRRDLVRGIMLGAAATGLAAALPLGAAASPSANWVLRWSPDPKRDGLNAFEGVEDDRAHSHPGVKHIYVEDDHWRFDMHTRDRDSSPDRQRNEVKGLRQAGAALKILENETWRITYQAFWPTALTATTSFSHIFQIKVPDVGSPLVTMTLRQKDKPTIEVITSADDGSFTHHPPVDYAPLQNKWIDVEWEFKAADSGGYLRWALRDGDRTVVDYRTGAVDLWRGKNYLRPKWGIYRSINSAGLRDCYQLTRNYRGYQLV
ncbi:hypothetical protein GCM10010174_36080 [Kutzneria viridogrisea]|uniref:Tat pathway signal sequence domain protein n=1 Tax=Kutzneria viridogrisea TaxID=47990 RepID=A0ABR6BLR0_9PSEU|nr:hypothetical protein [Kutzneria viridogrisea]